ncbi:MAG: nucleoside triphosphate pyrophosphohydrolase [Hyphomonadaceae bacterium]|nr:MAG: ATP diphosphatase [Caulobacteraceae bacterium]MBT9445117.1 nucleoside triphosphate pyrophosphohydrolase [Hyphomonadaceae bacterium]TPW08441.1 MAG: ATP diphosphatase [Alphaproteobacteria bacterium]
MHDPISENTRLFSAVERLQAVMVALRTPETGCPWDIEQTFETIAPYTIEEAYEVADAIQRGSMPALKEELGDLLFQVLFHSRMAEEDGAFALADVIEGLNAKMIERHPHVFANAEMRSAAAQTTAWETMKAEKRKALGATSLLDDVALALPALMRAEKLTKRAARIGFDWPTPDDVLRKLDEELAELAAGREAQDEANIAEEMGDILFVMANLARKLGVDPEEALRQANAKFERRFKHMEATMAAEGGGERTLEALEALWNAAKRAERA